MRCSNSDIDWIKIIESVKTTQALTKVLLTQQQKFLLLFNKDKVISQNIIKAKDQENDNDEVERFIEDSKRIDEGKNPKLSNFYLFFEYNNQSYPIELSKLSLGQTDCKLLENIPLQYPT